MEDAATSNPSTTLIILSLFSRLFRGSTEFWWSIFFAALPNVIDLLDDDEDMPLRPRKRGSRKTSADKAPPSTLVTEPMIQEVGDTNRTAVTFTIPLTSAQPAASTAQTPDNSSSLFAAHHVPEDQAGAAREAIRQASIMMERMKVIREASQAAYDASSAL